MALAVGVALPAFDPLLPRERDTREEQRLAVHVHVRRDEVAVMVLMEQKIVALAQIVRDGMTVERVVANDQTVIGDVPGGDMRRHRGRELLTNEIDACDLVKTREDRGEHLAL